MEPISNVLFGLFRGTPRHGEWVVACLEGAWPALVGERIAGVCRPARVEGSVLTIEVLDGAWEEPLREMRTELLQRISQGTGNTVSDLQFARH